MRDDRTVDEVVEQAVAYFNRLPQPDWEDSKTLSTSDAAWAGLQRYQDLPPEEYVLVVIQSAMMDLAALLPQMVAASGGCPKQVAAMFLNGLAVYPQVIIKHMNEAVSVEDLAALGLSDPEEEA